MKMNTVSETLRGKEKVSAGEFLALHFLLYSRLQWVLWAFFPGYVWRGRGGEASPFALCMCACICLHMCRYRCWGLCVCVCICERACVHAHVAFWDFLGRKSLKTDRGPSKINTHTKQSLFVKHQLDDWENFQIFNVIMFLKMSF